MSEHNHDIRVLNGLIETTIDSADGYQKAAEDAKNARIAQLFRQWASERTQVVSTLRQAVRQEGGKPEDDGTVLASAHRMFVGMRASMSKNDKAVIEEVERGEDHIKSKYEDALKDKDLSVAAREVVQLCYTSVRTGHDEMSAIKHSIAG
ncbi:PA2169 family four-helix-bundle protein [Dyella sp. C11]|uniref:PA2169 family four-helix-bundle protein n=1 Tax=Dyella sp. C11 TaxID=2126991 RepID=UPI000D642BCA|nr:PA2169 family four-helix-bundle protein [Dyella sp. C11]